MRNRRRRFGSGSSFDSDAQAFFTYGESKGGTFTTAEKEAWNTAVLALKAADYWDQIDCIYPMIGSNTNLGRIDAKRLSQATVVNSPTYSRTVGYTLDGASQYINPIFNPIDPGSHWEPDAGHIGVSFSSELFGSFGVPIGGVKNSEGVCAYMLYLSTTEFHIGIGKDTITQAEVADTGGYYSGTRLGTNTVYWYENETELLVDSTDSSTDPIDTGITIGALYDSDFDSVDPYWSGAPICSIVIAGLISDTTVIANIMNTFNDSLGRFPG